MTLEENDKENNPAIISIFFLMFLKFNNLLQLVSNLFTIAFMYDM